MCKIFQNKDLRGLMRELCSRLRDGGGLTANLRIRSSESK
jgi:hypothetical protein